MATRRDLITTAAIAPVLAATARLEHRALAQARTQNGAFVLVPGQ